MGGLLAFRIGNYDNTAEREQFRFLCEQLKVHYENSNEFCVFVGNYNIGCELDALFIKRDAIISIEFKNYGGNVVANENGEWTCDGVTIKGGYKKTVLQQARINHSTVKKELKVLGVDKKQIKDVPHLVVFHQDIKLDNKLSATNKSWLHVTDDVHFVEKLADITCPHTDLDPLGIVTLAELLNLNSFYLAEFSNATYDKPTTPPAQLQLFEDIKTYESPKVNETLQGNAEEAENKKMIAQIEDASLRATPAKLLVFENDESIIPLLDFSIQILSAVLKDNKLDVNIMRYANFCKLFPIFAPAINQEHIIIAEGDYTEDERLRLQRFLKKEVFAISEKMFCWQMGEYIEGKSLHIAVTTPIAVECIPKSVTYSDFPKWLDKLIYDELNAKFAPDHVKFKYNLNLDRKEVFTYLGTYFPRSYTEVYNLFSKLLQSDEQKQFMGKTNVLKILDLGCGTGGDLLGLLSYIEDNMKGIDSVKILAIDGNHDALRVLEKVFRAFISRTRLHFEYIIGPVFIENEDDLNLISGIVSDKYDIILSCKVICEMASDKRLTSKPYKNTALMLSKKLADNGIMLIEDVTIKSSDEFIPITLNTELNEFVKENPKFVTLFPISCRRNGDRCTRGCFFKEEIKVSHSRKKDDLSKVTYRFISHKHLLSIFENSNEITNIQCKIS